MVQLKPERTCDPTLAPTDVLETCQTYFVQDWRNDLVENHNLVSCGREHLIKGVCLIAERIRTHGKLHALSLDAISRHHNAAILPHFTVIAASTPNNHVDVSFFALVVEIAL